METYFKILAVIAATFGTGFLVMLVTAFAVSIAKDVIDEVRSRDEKGDA